MKHPVSSGTRERTRRAILEAMVDVIMDADGIGFSVQAVADRAGVTHRTIYNHFPTRDALCDAFSEYVDEVLTAGGQSAPAVSVAGLPEVAHALYRALAEHERHNRAYVMLMIGNRRPMTAWRNRSRAFEKLIARERPTGMPITPRQVTAAVRMFVSTMGWHLLTEQSGLSTEEAAATSAWATRVLLDAALNDPPTSSSLRPSRGANATRPRRA